MIRLAVAVVLAAVSCAHVTTTETAPLTKSVALSSLPNETAGAVAYAPSRYADSVLLVTFVASWCFPCLTDLPVLEKFERDFSPKNFHNLVVGLDLEGAAALTPMARQFELSFPVLVGDDLLRSGKSVFGAIRELPVRVLFSRRGEALEAYVGVVPPEALRAAIEKAVADSPAP